MGADISIKRIYEQVDPADGCRVLVDRLWPRGLKRETAALDQWMKELGPSNGLRNWFGHRIDRWEAFVERYRRELDSDETRALLEELAALADAGPLTLLYSANDEEHNQAVVILEALQELLRDR